MRPFFTVWEIPPQGELLVKRNGGYAAERKQ